jgi:hypothetical protein
MKHIVALIGSVVLAACGGGGGGGAQNGAAPMPQVAATQVFDCVAPSVPTQDRYRIAAFDVPRDHGSLTVDGVNATGFVGVARQLDRARCVGFDTVSFQTFIPIDPATGLLKEYDSLGTPGDRDKRLPPDYWRWVDYARSIGLRVVLMAVPADYRSDQQLWKQAYPNLPVDTMLSTVKDYYVNLAREAQRRGVDALHIGYFQLGFDTTAYATSWQSIVSAVKSVYTGKTIYATCSQCTDNVLWSMVDVVSVSIRPGSKTTCSASVTDIKNSYAVEAGRVSQIRSRYNKPVWLDQITVDVIGCAMPATATSSYQLLLTNQLTAYTATAQNYQWQSNSLRAVFELLASDLLTSVNAIAFGQYIPWLEAAWIQTPQNSTASQFMNYAQFGYSLYSNVQAQKTLQEYLGRPWGHRFYY